MTKVLRRLPNQRRSTGQSVGRALRGASINLMIYDDYAFMPFPPFRAKLWFHQSDQ